MMPEDLKRLEIIESTSDKVIYPHITSMIFNTPLLITQIKLYEIMQYLGSGIGIKINSDNNFMAIQKAPSIHISKSNPRTEDGMAIIPIFGTLVHRNLGMDALSGLTSYHDIMVMFHDAINDPDVKSVLLDIDSNGGQVAGVFDLADMIYEARGQKPIIAIANESAHSAAYAIASAADEIYLSRTAGVGSVGVMAIHADMSGAEEKAGIKYTPIYAGNKKNDFSPHGPISNTAMIEAQQRINEVYDIFTETVARNREIPKQNIINTQAGIYIGDSALTAGLADGIKTYNEIIQYTQSLTGGNTAMFQKTTAKAQEPTMDEMLTKVSELDGKIETFTTQLSEAKTEIDRLNAENAKAKTDQEAAIKAETKRIDEIMGLCATSQITDSKQIRDIIGKCATVDEARKAVLDILTAHSQDQTIESRTDINVSGGINPLIANANARAKAFENKRSAY